MPPDPRSQNSFLRACDFEGCELVGVDWSLWWPEDRGGSALAGVRSCRLEQNVFDGLNLRGSTFAESSVRASRFDACDLRDCDLRGCDLYGTGFADCRMQRADLTGARGYRLSLLRNRVQGARGHGRRRGSGRGRRRACGRRACGRRALGREGRPSRRAGGLVGHALLAPRKAGPGPRDYLCVGEPGHVVPSALVGLGLFVREPAVRTCYCVSSR